MDVNVLLVLNSTNNPSFVTPAVVDNHQLDSQLVFEYGYPLLGLVIKTVVAGAYVLLLYVPYAQTFVIEAFNPTFNPPYDKPVNELSV